MAQCRGSNIEMSHIFFKNIRTPIRKRGSNLDAQNPYSVTKDRPRWRNCFFPFSEPGILCPYLCSLALTFHRLMSGEAGVSQTGQIFLKWLAPGNIENETKTAKPWLDTQGFGKMTSLVQLLQWIPCTCRIVAFAAVYRWRNSWWSKTLQQLKSAKYSTVHEFTVANNTYSNCNLQLPWANCKPGILCPYQCPDISQTDVWRSWCLSDWPDFFEMTGPWKYRKWNKNSKAMVGYARFR